VDLYRLELQADQRRALVGLEVPLVPLALQEEPRALQVHGEAQEELFLAFLRANVCPFAPYALRHLTRLGFQQLRELRLQAEAAVHLDLHLQVQGEVNLQVPNQRHRQRRVAAGSGGGILPKNPATLSEEHLQLPVPNQQAEHVLHSVVLRNRHQQTHQEVEVPTLHIQLCPRLQEAKQLAHRALAAALHEGVVRHNQHLHLRLWIQRLLRNDPGRIVGALHQPVPEAGDPLHRSIAQQLL